MRAVSRLCGFYPVICLTTEEKARKNLSQGGHTYSYNKNTKNNICYQWIATCVFNVLLPRWGLKCSRNNVFPQLVCIISTVMCFLYRELKFELKIIPVVSNNVQFHLIYIRSSKGSTHSLKIWMQYKNKCAQTISLRVTFHTCYSIKPLNSELNPICHLLALLGAHHFLHVSRIRVKQTCFFMAQQPLMGQSLLIVEASRSHSETPNSVGPFWTNDQPDAEISTWQNTTLITDRPPWRRWDSNPQF